MDFFSPLRYPGGKGKVSDFFKNIIQDNNLLDGTYIEPYVGGGSVALSLLINEYVNNIIINDKDISIYAFWYSVLFETDVLCKMIQDSPINMDIWKKQKCIQQNKINEDYISLGFSTFFLNRTNRSGILNAGVIGGNNQIGNYKMDVRMNKKDLIRRIQRIADYSDRITLYNSDAVELISKIDPNLQDNSIYYFDPPYYIKGKGLYMNYYMDKDHQDIANTIKEIRNNHKWIVSYDNVPFIRNLYQEFRQKEFELNYYAGTVSKGKEVMIFSDNINISAHKLFNDVEI